MAKIYGLFGAMTGKVADVVMVVRNGAQIARKYQPIVSNPSSPAQVAARAKLKMMSQLASVMAPVIAIPKRGIVSARNLFVSANYPAASYDNGEASIELSDIKITRSVVSLIGIVATRNDNQLSLALSGSMQNLSRVVYCLFSKQPDDTLRFVSSSVVSEQGEVSTFPTSMLIGATPHVVYAYGVRDNTEAARVAFGNLQAVQAETVAKLIASSVLTDADITVTETQYAAIAGAN